MKALLATAGLFLICHSFDAAADQADPYHWLPSLMVEIDIDRNGTLDSARLGIATSSVGLLITLNAKTLPVIDIPIDGSQQFGICPGIAPTIRIAPQSEAPLNALGETPRGYEICPTCMEVVVGGGECDSMHFYWDTVAKDLAWWRA